MMLAQLQSSDTLDKFAATLGYTPAGLSYILFKIPDGDKYQTFNISKAGGGIRTIHAPTAKLKRLQNRLRDVLQQCNNEINLRNNRPAISHGFEIDKSIFTNAWEHKRRRFVLNIDIEDFFPSVNFGRIRGFLSSNRDYALPVKAATLIAQIACFQGKLPQGSPCSPILANLIAHLLDVRLARFAKAHRCTYSRYADDLTFSTNQKKFPAEIAEELPDLPGSWVLSEAALGEIARTGFRLNHHKTRMQCRPSKQLVTGLTVNEKVNIQANYYRKSRKMCSSLFNHGHYYKKDSPISTALSALPSGAGLAATVVTPKLITEMAPLEGILSHIYYIKNLQVTRSNPESVNNKSKISNKVKYPAYRNLYKKFLYFRHFINPASPLIMCEGKTDNIYLRSALKALDPKYPTLSVVKDGKLYSKINFLKHSRTEHDILELSGGSGNIANFIAHYRGTVFNYKYRPMKYPVIILVDNDSGQSGGGGVFSQANKLITKKINFLTKDDFYHLCHNLYLIKTPELGATGESCMEDLFDATVRAEIVGGKTFDPKEDKDTSTKYGKFIFADQVVRKKFDSIDFSKFNIIFDRILAVIAHYDARKLISKTT